MKLIRNSWFNLSNGGYNISFTSFNPENIDSSKPLYPTAFFRASMSSIPYPSHISITLNGKEVNLSSSFPSSPDPWDGSKDRRWVEIPLSNGLPNGVNHLDVQLTQEGYEAEEGQGGKMITSLEIIEYGDEAR